MKVLDKVQVWDDKERKYLGWGTIIQIAVAVKNHEEIPLIQLESGKKVWGDRCFWIGEKRAIEIGLRIFRDLRKKA